MKLLKTSSIDTVKHCQEYFGFDLPSVLWAKRMQKLEVKFGLYLSSEWNSVSAMSVQLPPRRRSYVCIYYLCVYVYICIFVCVSVYV